MISGQVTAELFVLHSVSIVQNSSEKLPQELLLCSRLVTEQVRRKWGVGQPPMQVMHDLACETLELSLPALDQKALWFLHPWSPQNYSGTRIWARSQAGGQHSCAPVCDNTPPPRNVLLETLSFPCPTTTLGVPGKVERTGSMAHTQSRLRLPIRHAFPYIRAKT